MRNNTAIIKHYLGGGGVVVSLFGRWCIDGWCTGGWCLTDCGGPSGPEMSRPIFFPSQIASGFRTDLAPRPGPV